MIWKIKFLNKLSLKNNKYNNKLSNKYSMRLHKIIK